MRRVTADINVLVSGLLCRRGKLRDTPASPQPAARLDVVHDDPDDNKILECAVADGSEYVVTGDKDLLRLKVYDSIRIMTAAEFLAMEK